MKLLVFVFLVFHITGYSQPISKKEELRLQGWLNKKRVDSLNGKPISYYLTHKGIDSFSKAFYRGQFPIFYDDISMGIMDSVLTENKQTRPFYLYNFNRMVEMVDAAVAEDAGGRAIAYFEKHTCEFLKSLKDEKYSPNIENWSILIGYELGVSTDNISFNKYMNNIEKKLMANCNKRLDKDWYKFKLLVRNIYDAVKEN